MRYAMVLNSRVIAIEVSETKPVYPPDFYGNPVIAIPCGEDIVLGMVYNETTESFEDYIPPEPEPTMNGKIYEAVSKSQDEVRQEGADMVMDEMKKRGLIV